MKLLISFAVVCVGEGLIVVLLYLRKRKILQEREEFRRRYAALRDED